MTKDPMYLNFRNLKIQDWITQQWVVLTGKPISKPEYNWLLGPFGDSENIGENFINQLAEREQLLIQRKNTEVGLLTSINELKLPINERLKLSQNIINFYENTSKYNLELTVKWNPFFKTFGLLINIIFSRRINQLNIPLSNTRNNLVSELITLINPFSNEIVYRIWLRKNKIDHRVVYAGIYSTTRLPSGKVCVKTIFPLPNGNATVILEPKIGNNNELILEASGNHFNDSGFYFLLQDKNLKYWSKYISGFTDKLILKDINGKLVANQIIKLWGFKVFTLNYIITLSPTSNL